MKIGIGNDHRGFELKNRIVSYLKNKNIEYIDYGTNNEDIVDFVDFAIKVGDAVVNNEVDRGILICGSGIGMCIAANKIRGIRCAIVNNPETAYITRNHNDANVIAISKETTDYEGIVDNFLNTEFNSEERYHRRNKKIEELENRY